MALDKQIHLYMVDTSCFYNEKEMKIHTQLNKLYRFKIKAKKIIKNKKANEETILRCKRYIDKSNKKIKQLKSELNKELKNNKKTRILNENYFNERNIISMFDSALTRTLKIPIDTLTTDIFIVRTFYFDVLKDLILNGFYFKGEKYVFFTASAGQIRTKKSVFIKESLLNKHKNTLMCGLTEEIINEQGGVNINKYIAYLALCNSATDEWFQFDINKAIVVEDMETLVEGLVDFIDHKSYKITRINMKIPIVHTDGCGIMLPRVSKVNFMVRLPWIKGLLSPFPFDEFIREKNKEIGFECFGKVKDIYGKEWDLLKDDIEIIFVKSQFKMWNYYKNDLDDNGNVIKYGWDKYREYFVKYNCSANICNIEEDKIPDSKTSYQILQTLTDVTYKELEKICYRTKKDILNIGNDLKVMLKILGVTDSNTNKNYLQQAIELYPELLTDNYTKTILKDLKKSLVKKARAGKLDIPNSKYTFIVPDLYAFCEYLIMNNQNPRGLLKNGEVFCSLYEGIDKLDCVRSPHLYKEHCIRINIVDDEKKRWFITKGLYISCHDLITKVIQADVDGDKSLIISNSDFIKIAERNMNDIVPLYYEMGTAKKQLINNQNIFDDLILAYKGGTIGVVSNDITKVWNSKTPNLDVVKILCMESNFLIDYAKTLYKPTRPKEIDEEIKKYVKNKVPHFFVYAKNKHTDQVAKRNKSTVNMLKDIIPNSKIEFKSIGLDNFDYKMLMNNKDIDIKNDIAQQIIKEYNTLDLKKYFIFNRNEEENDKIKNIIYTYKTIKESLLKIHNDKKYVTDILIEYLYNYKKSNFKATLWSCFGDVIVDNIKTNIKEKLSEGYICCSECNKLIKPTNNRQKYCKNCWERIRIEQNRNKALKYYHKTKTLPFRNIY